MDWNAAWTEVQRGDWSAVWTEIQPLVEANFPVYALVALVAVFVIWKLSFHWGVAALSLLVTLGLAFACLVIADANFAESPIPFLAIAGVGLVPLVVAIFAGVSVGLQNVRLTYGVREGIGTAAGVLGVVAIIGGVALIVIGPWHHSVIAFAAGLLALLLWMFNDVGLTRCVHCGGTMSFEERRFSSPGGAYADGAAVARWFQCRDCGNTQRAGF